MNLLSLCVKALAGLLFARDAKTSSVPSVSDWPSLAEPFGIDFVTIRPPAAPCHQSSYNATECTIVVGQWTMSTWRSSQIGAMQAPIWEQLDGKWCDISVNSTTGKPNNSTLPIVAPCVQGNVPRFGINATTPTDVQKAVQFANKFSIPLVVKSSGHDYLGRSSDPNRLLIWTHFMKNITYGTSQICGSNLSDTLVVSAGVQWGEAYRALAPHQRVTPGGADPDVGASGGQVMGGGHSPLGNTYGLTPDNVLQYEAVTLDGEMRVVNECTHADLFWALRGGGGGTYAIVTSTTFKTYTDAPLALGFFGYSNTENGFALGLDHLANSSTALAEMGWSGYFYGTGGSFSGIFFLPLINNITFQDASESLQPLFMALNNTKGLSVIPTSGVGVQQLPSAQFYLSGFDAPGSTGSNTVIGSRLIPKASLQDPTSRAKIVNYIASIRNDTLSRPITAQMVCGGATSRFVNNSVLPAWRKAIWQLAFTSPAPPDASSVVIERNFQLVTELLEPLRQLTPGSGAYMNEANPRAPQWKEDFFGENYERLLAIKKRWDPKNLLRCNRCVGSDM
jgi:FAD/FMN-containing dehydrogenase